MNDAIRLICDRIEEGIAVLLPDVGAENYLISADELTTLSGVETAEGVRYLCKLRDGKILAAESVPNEAAGENRRRLDALFQRSANKKSP